MDNIQEITKVTKYLSYNQKTLIRFLKRFESPLPANLFGQKSSIISLYNRGLIERDGEYILLSALGKDVLKYWYERLNEPRVPRRKRKIIPEGTPIKKIKLSAYRTNSGYSDIMSLY
jgi:hypothetical protein